jgi:Tol biopolymer transport system component
MDDLRDRFGRLDRIEAPDLWNEAVARSRELGVVRRRPISRTFVLVAAALLLAALAGAIAIGYWLTRPAPDLLNRNVENGLIVGQSECQLVAIDPVSGETRELVPSPPGCSDGEHPQVRAAWSADGRYLAYTVTRDCGACFEETPQELLDEAGPWVYDATTGATRHLEPCPERHCDDIAISSDGSLVAYTARTAGSSTDGRFALIVNDIRDGGSTRRVELPEPGGRPEFSPDGSRIVVAVGDGVVSALYVVNLVGTLEATVLTDNPGLVEGNPTWAPDGQWVAFDGYGTDGGIWVVRADGTEPRLLVRTTDLEEVREPDWSPDGTRIAFIGSPISGAGGTAWRLDLFTVAVDGGEPSLVYMEECCTGDWSAPTWSPDGEYIAVVGGPTGYTSHVALVRADGTEMRVLTDFPIELDWQPIPLPSPTD